MDGIILGFDLCDDYSQMSCFSVEKLDAEPVYIADDGRFRFPTVICKKKNENAWFVGESAYRHTLMGEGILVDKLLKQVEKDGGETIEGIRYSAAALLEFFLREALEFAKEKYQASDIKKLVFSLQNLNVRLMDTIISSMDALNISRECVHIISRTESYMYYILSQRKDIWNNTTALFDLSDEGLHYYEMRVYKGGKPQVAEVRHQKLEEGFSLDILENTSGGKMADQILCACSERLMQKNVFSSVLLSGKGFDNSSWAEGFMKAMGSKRKLFLAPNVFSMGAAYKAYDITIGSKMYPYIGVCEGTLAATIFLKVSAKGRERQLLLASAGDNWYEARTKVDLITEKAEVLDIYVSAVDSKQIRTISIPLEGFPKRPPRTTKIEILAAFTSESCMKIRIVDKGFGELFPPCDVVIREEIYFGLT